MYHFLSFFFSCCVSVCAPTETWTKQEMVITLAFKLDLQASWATRRIDRRIILFIFLIVIDTRPFRLLLSFYKCAATNIIRRKDFCFTHRISPWHRSRRFFPLFFHLMACERSECRGLADWLYWWLRWMVMVMVVGYVLTEHENAIKGCWQRRLDGKMVVVVMVEKGWYSVCKIQPKN